MDMTKLLGQAVSALLWAAFLGCVLMLWVSLS